jgi:hypothetical protein
MASLEEDVVDVSSRSELEGVFSKVLFLAIRRILGAIRRFCASVMEHKGRVPFD